MLSDFIMNFQSRARGPRRTFLRRSGLADELLMAKPKIVIFTQPDCPPCRIVKSFLTERGIAFEERDITVDRAAVRELTDKYHSHSTPTLVIGEEVMIGFNPERLDEILGS
jgi:glutaredoxin-like YruB-family protein